MSKTPIDVTAKLAQSFIVDKTFTDDSGKSVTYRRLVHVVQLGSKQLDIEVKATPRDLELIEAADAVVA